MNIAARILLALLLTLASVGCVAKPLPWPNAKPAPVVTAATVYGDIDDESAAKTIAQIQAANLVDTNAPLPLYINSGGGDILAGGMIIDAMAASRRPVHTFNIGMAASMAAWIHSYGVKRYMAPHSVLMFHNASVGVRGELPQVANRMLLIARVVDEYEQHIAKQTGLSLDQIRLREAMQWWLLPSDALAAHLIDGVALSTKYPTE